MLVMSMCSLTRYSSGIGQYSYHLEPIGLRNQCRREGHRLSLGFLGPIEQSSIITCQSCTREKEMSGSTYIVIFDTDIKIPNARKACGAEDRD